LKRGSAPGAQPADALERFNVVVEGWPDESPDVDIRLARGFPIVEPMNELFEARERKRAALSRFRDKAIPADVSAGRMT
jgi:hypothetical protein